MGVTKAEIKMGTLNELGATIDDMLESANRELQQALGAKSALVTARQKVEELASVVAQDFDAGEIEKLCGEPMDMVKYVNRMIMRAGGVVDNLATSAEVQRIQAVGAAASLQVVVNTTKKMHDAEKAKVDAGSVEEMGAEKGDARPQSAVMSAAEDIAQRRAEAKAAKDAKSNGESKKKPRKKRAYKKKASKKASTPVELPEVVDPSEDAIVAEPVSEEAEEAKEM